MAGVLPKNARRTRAFELEISRSDRATPALSELASESHPNHGPLDRKFVVHAGADSGST